MKTKIDEAFDDQKNEVAIELRKLNSKSSFTLDAWTSLNMTAYLSVTIHFIDEEFEMKNYLLDFVHLSDRHREPFWLNNL